MFPSFLAGLAGGGGMGLGALLGPLGLSFAPSLLGKLFGGDPQKKLRQQLMQLQSPQNIANQTNQFYNAALASPAFSQAQGQIAAGANQAGNTIAGNLAQRGIGTSGVGAILPGLVSSMVGQQQAGLRTSAYSGAQQQAQNAIQQQIQALLGTSGPSQNQQLFAGGLEAFAPYLQSYFASRYPNIFGTMNTRSN